MRVNLRCIHCISQHSQGVLGAADLAVHSLHSISVKKGSKIVFSCFSSSEAGARGLITTYNVQKKKHMRCTSEIVIKFALPLWLANKDVPLP